jgi:hypothetical protein
VASAIIVMNRLIIGFLSICEVQHLNLNGDFSFPAIGQVGAIETLKFEILVVHLFASAEQRVPTRQWHRLAPETAEKLLEKISTVTNIEGSSENNQTATVNFFIKDSSHADRILASTRWTRSRTDPFWLLMNNTAQSRVCGLFSLKN